MFINPILPISNSQNSTTNFKNFTKNRIARNRFKILLTQDIWAPRLKVKMPETSLEKEVLLEVLGNRLKLDRFTILSKERFATKADVIIYNNLLEKDPKNPEISEIEERLDKKGNLVKYIRILSEQINKELKQNREAMNYFKNIEHMEEDYLKSKLLKESKIGNFFTQIQQNNINPDGKYTTEELIEIVKNAEITDSINKL